MKRLLFILFLFGLGTTMSHAQEDYNYKFVDSKTYTYYYHSQWDSLIILGKEAQKHGIDYYYLNYRLAIAYFYKGNYFTSSYYFSKAYQQNRTAFFDKYFKEMYFRSLIYSRQISAANLMLDIMDSLENVSGVNYKGDLYIYGLLGSVSPTIPQNKMRAKKSDLSSETVYQQSIYLGGLSYNGVMGEKVTIDANYSYAYLNMLTAIENSQTFDIRNYSVKQNTINIKPTFWINRENSLSIAIGFSSVSGKPYGIIDSATFGLGYYNYSSKSFMGGLSYKHIYKNMVWGVNASISNFGIADVQTQVGASFTWYPKGNLDLYTITEINEYSPYRGLYKTIIRQEIGFKISKELWFEALGTFGDINNFTSVSNNYSYELPYHTYGFAGGKFVYLLNTNINIFMGAQYWWNYVNKKQIDFNNKEYIETINYQQLNFIGGLQWKF